MDPLLKPDTRWWAVDRLIIGYYLWAAVLVLAYFGRIPNAGILLAWHGAALGVLWTEVKRPNPTSAVFRHWYPLLYVAASYKEMAILIPAIRNTNADQWLADLDYWFWGAHPTVWLERIASPAVTELVQIAYALFIPAVLLVPFLMWSRRRYAEFRYYAFLIATGFLVSYIGYLIVPARGPRFLLRDFQNLPLSGLWLFDTLQITLDRLESAHWDCFPSGHTELTVIAWWGSRAISPQWSRVYFAYTLCIIFATVYLRYHYTVDVLAGVLTAALLIAVSPVIYRKLSPKGFEFGDR